MKGLIQNEVIKTRRQSGFKVLIILILVLSLLLPVGHFLLNKVVEWLGGVYGPEDMYDMYLEEAEYYVDGEEAWETVEHAVILARADTVKFFLDTGLADGWKYEMFQYELMDLKEIETIYRLLAEGAVVYRDVESAGYDWMVTDELWNDRYGEAESDPFFPEEEMEDKGVDLDSVNWSAEYARKKEEREACEAYVLECTSKILLGEEVESAKAMLESARAVEAVTKAELDAVAGGSSPSATHTERYLYESALYDHELAVAQMKACEEQLWGVQFLYDHDCAPDSWEYRAVTVELANASPLYFEGQVMLPRTVWEEQNNDSEMTYEKYLKEEQSDPDRRAVSDLRLTIRHALEEGVSLKELDNDSVKSQLRGYLSTVIGVITILMIVMMAMSVANEHSSGTIRLLLIRPRRRHKILTSKVLCVLGYGLSLTAVCGVILTVTTMIFFGVGDLFVPDLYVEGGRVLEIPAILTTLGKACLTLLGIFLYLSLALFFAVVSKRAVLAIVFPMLFQSVAALLQMISLEVVPYLPFLKFTVLPFLAPEAILTAPIESATYTGMGMYYGEIASMSGIYGVFLMLLHIALFGGLSYLIFERQQIKS